jgi:hypothetical protein
MDNNEENRVYGCPKCKIIWRNDPDYDDETIQILDPPEDADKILPAVEGEEFEVEKFYPQKLCPSCGETIINGKRKGPVNKIDLKKEGIEDIKGLKCPVCGSEDAKYEPGDIFPEDSGTFICQKCSSHIYIEFNRGNKLTSASYREDLEYTNQLKEDVDFLSRIMKKKGRNANQERRSREEDPEKK